MILSTLIVSSDIKNLSGIKLPYQAAMICELPECVFLEESIKLLFKKVNREHFRQIYFDVCGLAQNEDDNISDYQYGCKCLEDLKTLFKENESNYERYISSENKDEGEIDLTFKNDLGYTNILKLKLFRSDGEDLI